MTNTAENLPDDVVRRAAAATGMSLYDALIYLGEVVDAGIVALVPDKDADAIKVLDAALTTVSEDDYTNMVWRNLNAAGWTVARLTDVARTDPCMACHGRTGWFDCAPFSTKPLWIKCPTCGGSGKRPADAPIGRYQRASEQVGIESETSQHGHDTAACSECREVYDAGHRFGADPPYRGMTPPADGLPGDGWGNAWLRVRVHDESDEKDGSELTLSYKVSDEQPATWEHVHQLVQMESLPQLHPDPDAEPAPRPTDGRTVDTHEIWKGVAVGWVEWVVYDADGNVTATGVEPTREAAEQAAQAARAAWDARLAGGAS